MRIQIIALGNRVPQWVDAAYQEYAKRLPAQFPLELIEIPLKTKKQEQQAGQAVLDILNKAKNNVVIAMEVQGKNFSTAQLADYLKTIQDDSKNLSILIGGPDGLPKICTEHADLQWSLSGLTLPHTLVRVFLAEALYRAWTVITNHPYHRA